MKRILALVLFACLPPTAAFAAGVPAPPWGAIPEAPQWELRMLGVTDAARLEAVRSLVGQRVVTVAVVGESGVSKSGLRPQLYPGSSFVYRSGPGFPHCDPGPGAHDTGQAAVILDLATALGLRLKLASYQAPDDYAKLAAEFAAAGERADIVVCYHSFWGDGARLITAAMASRPRTLYLMPYGEVGDPRTGTSSQAASYKPWGGGLPNLFTCAPLSRKSDGSILAPANRDAGDTEIINFLAPSFHANGPGGTCPAVGVVAAVAAYACAAAPRRPDCAELVRLLRDCVTLDEAALTCAPPFTADHVAKLRASLAALAQPGPGGPRKLDCHGVLSLYELFGQLRGAQDAAEGPR